MVWPWGKQHIGIGIGLRYVPNKYMRRNKGYQQYCVVIFVHFWGKGISRVFGVVIKLVGCGKCITFILVISLIIYSVCDLVSGMNDESVDGALRFVLPKWIMRP